jgi:hypothetical protein
MSKKYKDKKWLREQIVEKELTLSETGDKCGVSKGTILRWKKKFGLEVDYKKTKQCENCSESVTRNRSQFNERVFCSKECHNEDKRNKFKFECDWCSKPSEKVASQEHDKNFCSRECNWDYHLRGGRHPNKNSVELECSNCGTDFERPESHTGETDNNFCDIECYHDWCEHTKGRNSNKAKKWRQTIRNRDNWTCQDCGEQRDNVEAHHIEEWSSNPSNRYDEDNGVTLCTECHYIRHKERNDARAVGLMKERVDMQRVEELEG